MIAPELEDDELNHDGPFYICNNCGQLLSKERLNNSEVCPNCEFFHSSNKWNAVRLTTALWWYSKTEGWLKNEVGFEDIQDAKTKAICELVLQKLSNDKSPKTPT